MNSSTPPNAMTTQLIQFQPQSANIRTVVMGGLPWFVAKDVCDALGIRNNRDAVSRLHDDEKGVATTDTLGGSQEMAIVNEPGLYRLIFMSRKPEADEFKRWVFHDVLPSIRKYGRYLPREERRHGCQGVPRGGVSPYVGVTYMRKKAEAGRRAWWARLQTRAARLSLGLYATAEEAARAYDRAAFDLYGEHARLNFPLELAA